MQYFESKLVNDIKLIEKVPVQDYLKMLSFCLSVCMRFNNDNKFINQLKKNIVIKFSKKVYRRPNIVYLVTMLKMVGL